MSRIITRLTGRLRLSSLLRPQPMQTEPEEKAHHVADQDACEVHLRVCPRDQQPQQEAQQIDYHKSPEGDSQRVELAELDDQEDDQVSDNPCRGERIKRVSEE